MTDIPDIRKNNVEIGEVIMEKIDICDCAGALSLLVLRAKELNRVIIQDTEYIAKLGSEASEEEKIYALELINNRHRINVFSYMILDLLLEMSSFSEKITSICYEEITKENKRNDCISKSI